MKTKNVFSFFSNFGCLTALNAEKKTVLVDAQKLANYGAFCYARQFHETKTSDF